LRWFWKEPRGRLPIKRLIVSSFLVGGDGSPADGCFIQGKFIPAGIDHWAWLQLKSRPSERADSEPGRMASFGR
jgi:hypothetical protein